MGQPPPPTERPGARQPAGALVDYGVIVVLTAMLMAILLIFFRDQVATVLAWITSLIG